MWLHKPRFLQIGDYIFISFVDLLYIHSPYFMRHDNLVASIPYLSDIIYL